MKPSRKDKAWAFVLSWVISVFVYYLGHNAVRMNEPRITPATCIYDPILDYVSPASYYLQNHRVFLDILTALDGLFIDFSLCVMGLIYMVTAKSISFLPTVIIFYLVRAIANNIVIFPMPDNYIFDFPGIPSYFVSYAKTNDLYYSGHTGMFVIYVCDSFQNKRAKWCYVFIPGLLFTVFILLIEGIHYFNACIIGFVAAAFISRAVYRYRYHWNLLFFKLCVLGIRMARAIGNFFRARLHQLRGKPGKSVEAGACPSINQSSLENVNLSAGPEASRR